MSKKNPEIDVFYIIKILFEAKLKIISLTIITTLIAVIYNYMQPNSYSYKAKIYKSQESVFNKYRNLNQILLSNSFSSGIDPQSMLERFFFITNNYNDLILFFKDDQLTKLKLAGLNDTLKQKMLIKHVKSFQISLEPDSETITVEFEWSDADEGIQVFENLMKIFLERVKLEVINEIIETNKIIISINDNKLKNLKLQVKSILEYQKIKTTREILILEDQYKVAKELGIRKSMEETAEMLPKGYERGYEAIEEEINILKNTSDEDLIEKSFNYLQLNQSIYKLKDSINENSLTESIKILKNDSPYDWVNYTTLNMNIKNLLSPKKNLILGLIFGLLIGSLYIIIFDAIPRSKKIK